MAYVERAWGDSQKTNAPFSLLQYNGSKPISSSEGGYMVNDGICYSTFSYGSGSYVPIRNMNTAISLGKDYAVYIEFSLASNMQVTEAQVISSAVGVGKDTPIGKWSDYPDYYRIRPQDDIKDEKVTKIIDGKRQEKAYLMIGRCYDTLQSFDGNYDSMFVSSLANRWSGYFVQYANSDIIMMGSQISGVPVVFPMPFWGGPATSDILKLKPKK